MRRGRDGAGVDQLWAMRQPGRGEFSGCVGYDVHRSAAGN